MQDNRIESENPSSSSELGCQAEIRAPKMQIGEYSIVHPNGTEEVVPVFESDLSSDESEEELSEDMLRAVQQGRFWYIIRPLFCNHQRVYQKCACMYQMKTTSHYLYDAAMLNDLSAIVQELRLREIASLQGRNTIEIYRRHRAVIVALTTRDKKLICDPSMDRGKFLDLLYEIRESYGYNADFGQREMREPHFQAQGVGEFITDMMNKISELIKTAAEKVAEGLKTVFDYISERIMTLFGMISETLGKMLESVFGKIRRWILNQFNPLEFIKESWNNPGYNKGITLMIILTVILIIDVIGFLTYKLLTSFIDKMLKQHGYVAQGPQADPTAGVVTVIGLVIGLCRADMATLSKRAREFSSLVAMGLSASCLLGSLFLVLPLTIQTALKMKFGTAESKDQIAVEDWSIRAAAVIRLKGIPKVLTSPEYYQWLTELHTEAMGMRGKIKTPTVGTVFVRQLVTITEILTILENYRDEKATRDQPFSLHISAPPGYGKTLFTTKLVRDVYGVADSDIYQVPVASEYWDGFIGKDIIVIDEFLVGDSESRIRTGKQVLELVSTKNFKPPLASVDNVSVGIKGTVCTPKGVVTICNTNYPSVKGIPDDALWRRREFVICPTIATKHSGKFEHGKIDLNQLTAEEIKSVDWLRFTLKPSMPGAGKDIVGLTYPGLVRILSQQYRRYLDTCERIRIGMGTEVQADKTPTEMLADTIRELKGIPNEPQSLSDAIFEFFGGEATAQGPQPSGEMDSKTCKFLDENGLGSHGMDESDSNPNTKKPVKVPAGHPLRPLANRLKRINARMSIEKIQSYLTTGEEELEASGLPDDNPIRQSLQNKIDQLWKSATNERRLTIDDGSDEDYQTSSEGGDVKELYTQRGGAEGHMIIANIDHSNVLQTVMHRHHCLGVVYDPVVNGKGNPMLDADGNPVLKRVICGKQYAHRHNVGVHTQFLCNVCQANGAKTDYTPLHGGGNPSSAIRLPELLPEDYLFEYVDADEKYKQELDKLWLGVCVDKFLSYGTTPIILVDDPGFNEGEGVFLQIPSAKECVRPQAQSVAKWVAIFVILYGIRRWFNKGENAPEELCFAQSPPARRERGSKRQARTYKVSAQGPANDPKMWIGEESYQINPIGGATFLTYYHAFCDGNGNLLPEGTMIKIKWSGKVDEFALSHSMMKCPETNEDYVLFTYPRSKVALFPNNLKKYWTLDDAMDFDASQAMIVIDGKSCYTQVKMVENRAYTRGSKRFELAECLLYPYPTKMGDCGSLIMSAGTSFPGKIMGMHVAGGNSGRGFFGIGIPIFKEDLQNALSTNDFDDVIDVTFQAQGPLEGPNLVSVQEVPIADRVFINRTSKITRSVISPYLDSKPKKHRPLLSQTDKRCNGEDPMINMVLDTLAVEHPLVDAERVRDVGESLLESLRKKLRWPIGKTRLSMSEAIAGIPGKLASMKVKTSAGYPLCKLAKKKGKTDFFFFDNAGILHIEPFFAKMVEDYLAQLETTGIDERRFLAYLKDELISEKKVKEGRCRVIYAGDVVSNVAYRMIFGHILAAFNSSFFETSSAIGLNQYSDDMEVIYDYLREVGTNFVAGDFKNFDKRVHPQFQMEAYKILMTLCDENVTTPTARESFVKQQCFSAAQVMEYLIKFKTTHFSGCFFTSIVNNLINEMYIRYCFAQLCPDMGFDANVRCKVLGDDHIYCFSDEVAEKCRPHAIRDQMALIGQVYTSDRKDQELTNDFRSFDQITFLGAHPILCDGRWLGALKKETLEETLHWTRNHSLTIRDEAKTVIELSSAWGKEYYENKCSEINGALVNALIDPVPTIGHSEQLRIVRSRTAASGHDFPYGFVAQGPPVNSLAKLNPQAVVNAHAIGVADPGKLSKRALNEESMNLDYGTESAVFRTKVIWRNSDAPESGAIAAFDVPFGLLTLGDSQNLQNMPFDRFAFWKGDVELHFQVNATPQQQGLAVAYFMPLASYESELANITTNEFVFIQPDQNATYTLRVPFKYLRSVMNTMARDTESLGTVFITPLSALNATDIEELTITVFSSFPDSNFTIPRPTTTEGRITAFYNAMGKVPEFDDGEVEYVAQGNSASTTNNYSFSNVGGDMPVQGITTDNNLSATQEIEVSPDVSIPMPLDNPPLCSGAVPVEQAFPGMSASHGVRPTRDMQLKPTAFSRQQMEIFNPVETKIENILAKMCLLTRFKVSTLDPPDTELYSVLMNTRMGIAEGTGIPVNIATLNQFLFWRADFEFTFISVQTMFHSMRLRAITSYGSPTTAVTDQTTAYTSNMSFAKSNEGVNYVHKELVPFNSQTEFLRTYQGEGVVDIVQNYSLGTFATRIANQLVASSDTVVDEVEVLVFLRILNAKVAVPTPASPWTWNDALSYNQIPTWLIQGRADNGRIIQRLIQVSDISSRTAYSDLQVIGDTLPDGSYDIENLLEVGVRFVYRNVDRTVVFVFIPETLSLIKQGTSVTWIHNEFDFEGQPTVAQNSEIILDRPPLILRRPEVDAGVVYEAQGPEEATSAEAAVEPGSVSVTMEEAPSRPNIPCKLELGEKFEFCVSDIHEIGRRYIRMVPVNNVEQDQFAVYSLTFGSGTVTHLNLPTQPQSHWKSLFAAWAGGIKFRLFRNREGGFPQTSFVPFYNQNVQTPSIPIIDAMSGLNFVYQAVSINSESAITGPIAREVAYPLGGNATYIDISTPFQSHYNFCYNSKTQDIAPISSGTLVLSAQSTETPTIFTAFADDLRLGIYRAPRVTRFDMTTFTAGVGGFFSTSPLVEMPAEQVIDYGPLYEGRVNQNTIPKEEMF